MRVNLRGAFCQSRCHHDLRRPEGGIIMMGSVTAFPGGHDDSIAHATSDAGVHARPHAMARELNPQRMTVNCTPPAFTAELSVYEDLPADPSARVFTQTPLAGRAVWLTQRSRRLWLHRRGFGHRRDLARPWGQVVRPVRGTVTAEGGENT